MAILISIKPEWVEKILSGEKTIEIRKTKPSCDLPCKVYIYCTMGYPDLMFTPPISWFKLNEEELNKKVQTYLLNGKVVAEFTLDKVDRCGDAVNDATHWDMWNEWNDLSLNDACIHPYDLEEYSNGYEIYAWHISNLKVYDKPKELREFHTICKENNCSYCPYHYHENNASIGIEEFCMSDGLKPITRPPQSWCYVEDLEEHNE